jgi:hypothetical protein
VPWHSQTIFFVPDQRRAQALEAEGIGRERLWTAGELTALHAGPPISHETLALLTAIKRDFPGEVVSNRPRDEAEVSSDVTVISSVAPPPPASPQGELWALPGPGKSEATGIRVLEWCEDRALACFGPTNTWMAWEAIAHALELGRARAWCWIRLRELEDAGLLERRGAGTQADPWQFRRLPWTARPTGSSPGPRC